MSQVRRGYVYGLAAYVSWGFVAIYFKALRPAGPLEILAHRVLWSVVFVALLITGLRSWRAVVALRHRPGTLAGIALAAVLIGVNWFTYIFAVNTDRIVETSLGYFINPLISVAFGVLLLRERLRVAQCLALGIGALAVAVLTVDYGRLPYIALTLAVSFGCYGLVKKRLGMPPAEGLLVESGVLAVPALAYVGWLAGTGRAAFGHVSVVHTVLMVLAGVVTAVPLLLFASSANRIPISSLGILQYVTPVLQFVVGVAIYREPMPPGRLAGFALVWLALVVFTGDGIRAARRAAQARLHEPAAVSARPAPADLVRAAPAQARHDRAPDGPGSHTGQGV